MRFKIELSRTSRHQMLPMDYQYYIGAWIYKVLQTADARLSRMLMHSPQHKFKFFNYSPLNLRPAKAWIDRSLFEIKGDKISLSISFHIAEQAERDIRRLFMNQSVFLGNRFNGIDLMVTDVENIPDPQLQQTMKYKAQSPLVVSKPGEKHVTYMSPIDSEYQAYFVRNMLEKLMALQDEPDTKTAGELVSDIRFELLNKPRPRLYTIKPDSPRKTNVKGFQYEFMLTAPEEVHRLGYLSGFGEKNNMGFGWCEPIVAKQNMD